MCEDDMWKLNIRATMALRGVGDDWKVDVLALLKSDVPIERLFRDELAKAILGDDPSGIKLTLSGHKIARDRSFGAEVRFKWMEIGVWIEDCISDGLTRHEALEAATKKFGSSYEKCEKALIYFQKVSRWLDSAQRTELGRGWSRDILESMYHARDAGSLVIDQLNHDAYAAFDTAYQTSIEISCDTE